MNVAMRILRSTAKATVARIAPTVLTGALLATPLVTPTFPTLSSGAPDAHAVLTADGKDSYSYSSGAAATAVMAPRSNQSSTLREVFWPARAVSALNEQTCATWADASTAFAQQGLALRIRRESDGVVHALTVTKNVFGGAAWAFDVHEWNSASVPAFRGLGGFDLSSVFRGADGLPRPLPWRICARVFDARLAFKVWIVGEPEPRWGDPRHGGMVLLDPSRTQPGMAGWYVGHLPPSGSADFTGLATSNLDGSWAPAAERIAAFRALAAPR